MERLRARLRHEVSAQLSSRVQADEDAAARAATRRAASRAVLVDTAEKQAQQVLDSGGVVVPEDVEQRVIAFWWLARMSRFQTPARFLTDLDALHRRDGAVGGDHQSGVRRWCLGSGGVGGSPRPRVRAVLNRLDATPAPQPIVASQEHAGWATTIGHREGVALLTNLSTRELPDKPVRAAKLPALPLLAPTAGLLAEFLRGWYGIDYQSRLTIIAEIDALYYGLGLLDSQLLRGCLLATSQVAHAAVDGRLPGGRGLRVVPLADDFDPPLGLVTGVFGRKNEREHYAPEHPLNLLWNEFARAPKGSHP